MSLWQFCGRALRLTLETVIVVAGHKRLPQLPQLMAPQHFFHFCCRFLTQVPHEVRKKAEAEFKNIVATGLFVYLALAGQSLYGAGFRTAQAVVADILF